MSERVIDLVTAVEEVKKLINSLLLNKEAWKKLGDLEYSVKAYEDAVLYELRIRIKRKKLSKSTEWSSSNQPSTWCLMLDNSNIHTGEQTSYT